MDLDALDPKEDLVKTFDLVRTYFKASLCKFLVLVFFGTTPSLVSANWTPEKNVEIIIGSAPGGGNDRAGRVMQNLLKELELVRTTISVVNRPGAGGFLAWTNLNQTGNDGHSISQSTPNLLTTHIVGRSEFTYSGITPIAQLYSESSVFVVKADHAIQNAKDLIERIKSDPTSFSSTVGTGAGNHNHIALGALAQALGADPRKLKVVVFRGSAEATTAVMGGHVDLAIVAASSRSKQIQAGAMRALAVASPQRLPGVYANVPTWKELGIDLTAAFWVGVIGSHALNPSQKLFWGKAIASLAQSAQWKKYLEQYNLEDTYMDSEASREFLAANYKSYEKVLTSLGLAKPRGDK